MNTEADFRWVLTTPNFGARPKTAIVVFYGDKLTGLAHLPKTELNASITNMYKSLANMSTAAFRVRLDVTKLRYCMQSVYTFLIESSVMLN